MPLVRLHQFGDGIHALFPVPLLQQVLACGFFLFVATTGQFGPSGADLGFRRRCCRGACGAVA